jgi:hypothetical protein
MIENAINIKLRRCNDTSFANVTVWFSVPSSQSFVIVTFHTSHCHWKVGSRRSMMDDGPSTGTGAIPVFTNNIQFAEKSDGIKPFPPPPPLPIHPTSHCRITSSQLCKHITMRAYKFVALLLLYFIDETSALTARSRSRIPSQQHCQRWRQPSLVLAMASEVNSEDRQPSSSTSQNQEKEPGFLRKAIETWNREGSNLWKLPPIQVDDKNLLLYDVVLILNLVVSISFWVVHRMQLSYIGIAFSEGCLLSMCWIVSGLFSGAFLDSAVDGHYGSTDERGGPKAAGLLGFQTFVNTVNLRLLFALAVAFVQHRPVGNVGSEELIPLEIGFGLILMSFWRTLHSSFVPR